MECGDILVCCCGSRGFSFEAVMCGSGAGHCFRWFLSIHSGSDSLDFTMRGASKRRFFIFATSS